MNLFWACLLLAGGLVMLWKCAELLVAGAVGLANHLGVSPLIIGLTIVAMGTSAPEVAASISAAVRGAGSMAIGNVYGSNIANLALVGGICAILAPIKIQLRTLQREIPVMLLVALLLWPILHNSHLSRPEGLMLLTVFAVLILLVVYMAKRENAEQKRDTLHASRDLSRAGSRDTRKNTLFLVIGLAGLALGAEGTVRGAVFIGRGIGMSEAVIGLTIIAIGTSLPELVTCVVAAVKKQDDISIGIMVGSNVFNALLAIGVAGMVRPFEIAQRLAGFDYWVMVIVSFAFALAALIGRCTIKRTAGIALLCGYIAYIVYLLAYSSPTGSI